jgi:hypothetical protein
MLPRASADPITPQEPRVFMSPLRPPSQRAATRLACGLAAVAAFALSGCAQTVRVSGAWTKDAAKGQAFSRVLVVGIAPDPKQRCPFEGFMVNLMRNDSTVAIRGCDAMPRDEPLSREAVERAVREYEIDGVLTTTLVAARAQAQEGGTSETEIDGVLTTTLVAARAQAQEGGTSETRGDAYYKVTDYAYGYAPTYYYGGWGYYGMPVTTYYGQFETATPITNIQGEAEILTRMYDTNGATLVYEMTTKAKGLVESRAAGLAEVTSRISERLQRDGVVR